MTSENWAKLVEDCYTLIKTELMINVTDRKHRSERLPKLMLACEFFRMLRGESFHSQRPPEVSFSNGLTAYQMEDELHDLLQIVIITSDLTDPSLEHQLKEMAKIFDLPKLVTIQADEPTDNIEQQGQAYFSQFQTLQNMYQDTYFVAQAKKYQTPEMHITTVATWTNFIPTVFPICEQIMLIILNPDNEMGSAYMIKETELIALLGDKAVSKDSPVPHIVVEEVMDDDLKQQILSSAKKMA